MQQKVLQNGNSLAVTIPSEFVKTLGLRPGQLVDLKVDIVAGKLIYKFDNAGQLSLLSK